jgi:hypothetical protein
LFLSPVSQRLQGEKLYWTNTWTSKLLVKRCYKHLICFFVTVSNRIESNRSANSKLHQPLYRGHQSHDARKNLEECHHLLWYNFFALKLTLLDINIHILKGRYFKFSFYSDLYLKMVKFHAGNLERMSPAGKGFFVLK